MDIKREVGGKGVIVVETVEPEVLVVVFVIISLHPNQRGVLQVEVEDVLVVVVVVDIGADVEVVAPVVVDSSRHPHLRNLLAVCSKD